MLMTAFIYWPRFSALVKLFASMLSLQPPVADMPTLPAANTPGAWSREKFEMRPD